MSRLTNIFNLGLKELWSLARDPVMIVLIIYTFTGAIYISATAMPEPLNKAPIAIVDEDRSPLSMRIISAFYPPQFLPVQIDSPSEIDPGMDAGRFTFALDIPPDFQHDVLRGHSPSIQLNVDATRMSQAFIGSGYIQQIVMGEVNEFIRRTRGGTTPPIDLALRARFNPALDPSWFGSLMELINNITILAIILAGAALIREREHGTVEHLLVMPVTPGEIMLAKIWSMGLIVLLAAWFSLIFLIRGTLHVQVEGSIMLFLLCAAVHLFAVTSMGIFLATIARSMPQFGLLMMLTFMPLEMLSGAMTPRESMPVFVQNIMLVAPNTHFVSAASAILYRGAGIDVVWPHLLLLIVIGAIFFSVALNRFHKTIGQMM